MPTFGNGRNNSRTACICLYIVFHFQNWFMPLCLRRRYFQRSKHVPGIPPGCDRLAEKLALLHLRLFPRPFSSHATECSGIVGEETSVCRFESVPTWVIANRWAHARQTRLSSWRLAYPILSYPILSYPVLSAGCFRCLAVNSVWDWSHI